MRGVRLWLASVGPWMAAALIPVAVCGQASGADQEEPPTVIYDGASLLDGTGGPMQPDMAIAVRAGRIEAVMPSTEVSAETRDGAEVVDVSGLFAIPGLIESHTHVATVADRPQAEFLLNRYVYAGITTARDMAGDVRALMDLHRAALVGEIASPDLEFSALVAGPSFFTDPRTVSSAMGETPGHVSWMQEVTAATDLTELVTLARGTWASGLKTYAAIDGELIAGIAAEARRQGIPVWSHTHVGPARPMEVARAGVTTMSHVCSLAAAAIPEDVYQEGQAGTRSGFVEVDMASPAIDEVLSEMVSKGTVLDATIRIYVEQERRRREAGEQRPPPPPDPRRRRGVRATCTSDDGIALARRAHEVGVLLSTGTDGMTPADSEWPALYDELRLFHEEVGMPMEDVIVAATRNGAIALGLEEEIGTVEPEKLANVVFLREDPRAGVASLQSIEFTVKRGHQFHRADFVLGTMPSPRP